MVFFLAKLWDAAKEKKARSVLIILLCDREEYKNPNNTAESNHNGEDYGSPPANHKDDTDSGASFASSTTTFEDSATSTTKEVC